MTSGTTYRYAVSAYRHDGTSEENNSSSVWSNIVAQTAPVALPQTSAPTGLTVASANETSIGLSWTAPVDDGNGAIEGYNIYRCDESSSSDCSDFPWLAWVAAADGTAYTDAAVTSGTTYRYAVSAYRHDGTSEENNSSSDWSDVVTAVVSTYPPEFPRISYTFNLPEKRVRGWQTPRGELYANDPDGDNLAVTYALTAGNPLCQGCGIMNSPYRDSLFRVASNADEARITYQGTGEDYESFAAGAAYYTLTLTATDEDNGSTSVSVRINITDVGEPTKTIRPSS